MSINAFDVTDFFMIRASLVTLWNSAQFILNLCGLFNAPQNRFDMGKRPNDYFFISVFYLRAIEYGAKIKPSFKRLNENKPHI